MHTRTRMPRTHPPTRTHTPTRKRTRTRTKRVKGSICVSRGVSVQKVKGSLACSHPHTESQGAHTQRVEGRGQGIAHRGSRHLAQRVKGQRVKGSRTEGQGISHPRMHTRTHRGRGTEGQGIAHNCAQRVKGSRIPACTHAPHTRTRTQGQGVDGGRVKGWTAHAHARSRGGRWSRGRTRTQGQGVDGGGDERGASADGGGRAAADQGQWRRCAANTRRAC